MWVYIFVKRWGPSLTRALPFETVLMMWGFSTGPRNQYKALLYLSTGSSKGVQGYKDRLGQGRSYAFKETDHRQGPTEGDGSCAESNIEVAAM